MTKLSVNLNKVAYLRNTRNIGIPDVLRAARTAIAAGAHGITVHPRPDQRHIRRSDVHDLSALLEAEYSGVELNIEGNPFPEFMELVRVVRPDQCTLVPDAPDAVTSDHGWDLKRESDRLGPIIGELRDLGIRVSLFMDPVPGEISRAKEVGADRVELYTEPYAAAHARGEGEASFVDYQAAARAAADAGLGLNAGHDLNLDNLPLFRTIPNLLEVSIGHALIGDALFMGLRAAVEAYLKIVGTNNADT